MFNNEYNGHNSLKGQSIGGEINDRNSIYYYFALHCTFVFVSSNHVMPTHCLSLPILALFVMAQYFFH